MSNTINTSAWIKDILKKYPAVKSAAGRLYGLVPARLRLGKVYWDWYAFLQTSEKWPLERVQEYQMEQLRNLLSLIKETSPYYGQILVDVNIRQIQTVADFQKQVPTLSRSTVHNQLDQILNRDYQKMKRNKASTSGTTGLALQFYTPASGVAQEWAFITHQWSRVGYDPARSIRAEFRGLTHSAGGVDQYPQQNMIRCSILDINQQSMPHFAHEIEKAGVTFYHGYPSALYLLARTIQQSGFSFPQPSAILLASEIIYDWQINLLREVFPSARLFAHYGCAEQVVLGGWCEHEQTYHVLPTYSLVEIDPQTSEIIGTNLYNTINGFVRYRMTDVILDSSQEICPSCKRPYTPRFTTIGGRAEDFLFDIEKGWLPPAIITYPFKSLQVILETQLRQDCPDEVEIIFEAQKGASEDAISHDQAYLIEGMHTLFSSKMKFKFTRVDKFDRAASGKFKWVLSKLQQPDNIAINSRL